MSWVDLLSYNIFTITIFPIKKTLNVAFERVKLLFVLERNTQHSKSLLLINKINEIYERKVIAIKFFVFFRTCRCIISRFSIFNCDYSFVWSSFITAMRIEWIGIKSLFTKQVCWKYYNILEFTIFEISTCKKSIKFYSAPMEYYSSGHS